MDVVGVSRNFQEIIPAASKPTFDRNLGDLFDDHEFTHSIRGALSLPTVTLQRVRIGIQKLGQFDYDVAVTSSEGLALIEFEKVTLKQQKQDAPVAIVRSMVASLDTGGSAAEFMESAVKSLRRLTGYDRIMAYQFLEDGTGEVVAEAKSPGVDPFLGCVIRRLTFQRLSGRLWFNVRFGSLATSMTRTRIWLSNRTRRRST